MQQSPRFQFRMNGLFGLVLFFGFLVMIIFLIAGFFKLLYYTAPVLFLLALVINYKTVTGFLKYLWDLLRRKPLEGILAVILSIFFFWIVSGFLFGKAILDRRINRIHAELKQRTEGELVDYEEIHDTEDAEILDLKTLTHGEQKKEDRKSPYEDFFDEENPKQ